MMKSDLLKFITILFVMLYQQGCSGETNCIRKATDLYYKLIDNSTCLSSVSVNNSLSNLKKCSRECSMIDSPAEDSYIRIQIKYSADIMLKLEHKKNPNCTYSKKDVTIDCIIDQNTLGSLQSCIIGSCLRGKFMETQTCPRIENGTDKTVIIYTHQLIIAIVIGFVLRCSFFTGVL